MGDAQLLERAADLGELGLVDLAARLGRVEVVRSPIGVERPEQALGRNRLGNPKKLEAVPSSATRMAE